MRIILVSLVIWILTYNIVLNLQIRKDILYLLTLVCPFVAFIFNYFIANMLNKPNVKNKLLIMLSDNVDGKYSVSSLIEIVFWGRTFNFKNNPSGNFIFLRSVLIVSWVVIAICLTSLPILRLDLRDFYPYMSINTSINIENIFIFYSSFMTAVGTVFWYERNKYKEKWEYIQGMYNDLLCCDDKDEPLKSNALAIDCVTLLQWGHRSVQELVYSECVKAIKLTFEDLSNYEVTERLKCKNKKECFSESEIIFILENYQTYIISKIENSTDLSVRGKISDVDWYKKLKEKYYIKNKDVELPLYY